jgi:hypothetical protein
MILILILILIQALDSFESSTGKETVSQASVPLISVLPTGRNYGRKTHKVTVSASKFQRP